MIDPAILRALEAAGATTDMIIAAVEAAQSSELAKKAARRAGNAERQRRFKSKHKATPNNADNALPSVTPPPNDIYSNPPPEPVLPNGNTSPCRFSVENAVEAWNATASRCDLPKAKTADGARAKNIRARLKAAGEEGWREALAAVERSKFCRGENDRGFRADLDFVCQPKSFNRLREGFYGADADAPGRVVQLDPETRAAELQSRAAFKRSIGRDDDALDLERKAARIRGPTPIGSLVRNIQAGTA